MITEDYVSFETAKLLKEKGFNKDTYTMSMYDENGEAKDVLLLKEGEEPVLRPTLQMAMKWLRKVHNLHIQPEITAWPRKGYFIKIYSYRGRHIDFGPFARFSDSYEQACEVAIKYCLENLI
jgi:hypothetical protein